MEQECPRIWNFRNGGGGVAKPQAEQEETKVE